MDNKNTFASEIDQKKFESVWQRVTGNSIEGTPPENKKDSTEMLVEFIENETRDMYIYYTLAKRVSSKVSGVIIRIAEDEKRHLRKLQTAYFMITGDTHKSKRTQENCKSILECMRKRYYEEVKCAQGYMSASQLVCESDLKEMFTGFAEEEYRHASEILKIIEGLMS